MPVPRAPHTLLRLIAAICLALPAGAARAEDVSEAKGVFDTLFAAKIKAAAATIDRADDVALAKDMLALAKTSANQPALVALLCDSAHDLGSKHADGYAAAIESLQLLADTVEEKKAAAREKLIVLLARQSSAGKPDEREPASEALIDLLATIGDEKVEKKQYAEAVADYRRAFAVAQQKKSASLEEVKAKMEFAASRDRTMKQLARLQEKLLADANDSASAEEIVKLYVVELDDPKAAGPYLNRVKDEQLKKLVPLASKSIDGLSEDECAALGEWYMSHDKGAAKAVANHRAQLYFARFLELHTTADLQRTKVEAWLKTVKASAPAGASSTGAKYVKIVNVRSKLELCVGHGSKADNALLAQGPTSDQLHYQWEIVPIPRSKAVRLRNRNSGSYMFVFTGKASVFQRSDGSRDGSNEWLMERMKGGVRFRSVLTKKVLAVSEGTLQRGEFIIQWDALDSEDQTWQIVDVQTEK